MKELISVLLALTLVIPLIVLVTYLLKRVLGTSVSSSKGIQVVNQLSLGAKERIVVIEVEQVKLIVGISATAFNTLHVVQNHEKKD